MRVRWFYDPWTTRTALGTDEPDDDPGPDPAADYGKFKYEQEAMRRGVVREARKIVREAESVQRTAERAAAEPTQPWEKRGRDRERR